MVIPEVVGALVREAVHPLAGPETATQTAFGPLHIRTGGALLNGDFSPLGRSGSDVLRILAARPGRVLSRGEIADELSAGITAGRAEGWTDSLTSERAVEVTVARIRQALSAPDVIETVHKRGYRLAVKDDELREQRSQDT